MKKGLGMKKIFLNGSRQKYFHFKPPFNWCEGRKEGKTSANFDKPTVWPDAEIKAAQVFPQVAQKVASPVWLKKRWMVFTTAQKDTKYLGYFCYKVCYQEIPKIAKSWLWLSWQSCCYGSQRSLVRTQSLTKFIINIFIVNFCKKRPGMVHL